MRLWLLRMLCCACFSCCCCVVVVSPALYHPKMIVCPSAQKQKRRADMRFAVALYFVENCTHSSLLCARAALAVALGSERASFRSVAEAVVADAAYSAIVLAAQDRDDANKKQIHRPKRQKEVSSDVMLSLFVFVPTRCEFAMLDANINCLSSHLLLFLLLFISQRCHTPSDNSSICRDASFLFCARSLLRCRASPCAARCCFSREHSHTHTPLLLPNMPVSHENRFPFLQLFQHEHTISVHG